MAKLLRTLRLDLSDTFVFPRAAAPGEWAIAGSVLFAASDPGTFDPKMRAAFRSGFLGVTSCGFATLVEVAEISVADTSAVVEGLARKLRLEFGAPSEATAADAAAQEAQFAGNLCEGHAPGTIVAMRRTFEDGEIKEQFRTLRRREGGLAGADALHAHARAFEFIEEEEVWDPVDLLGLTGRA